MAIKKSLSGAGPVEKSSRASVASAKGSGKTVAVNAAAKKTSVLKASGEKAATKKKSLPAAPPPLPPLKKPVRKASVSKDDAAPPAPSAKSPKAAKSRINTPEAALPEKKVSKKRTKEVNGDEPGKVLNEPAVSTPPVAAQLPVKSGAKRATRSNVKPWRTGPKKHPACLEDDPDDRKLFGQFKRGKVKFDDIAEIFAARAKRFAKVATYNYGIRDECADDVAQQLLLMLPELAINYIDGYPVEPLLHKVAMRLAYAEKNKTHRKVELTSTFAPSEEGWAAHENSVSEQDKIVDLAFSDAGDGDDSYVHAEAEIDRRNALDRIAKKLYDTSQLSNDKQGRIAMTSNDATPAKDEGASNGMPLGDISTVTPTYPPLRLARPEPKAKRKKDLAPDQEELIAIRKALRMSQPDFAAALGINVPRLSSYEYGRTNKVPEAIMTLARELLKRGNKTADDIMSRYGNLTMADILKRWADEMSVNYDDTPTLAAELGTTETTIRRWRNNDAKPGVQALIRYEQVVKRNRLRNEKVANTNQRLVMYTVED